MRTDQLRVDMVHQHQLHLVLVDTFLFVDTQTRTTLTEVQLYTDGLMAQQ